MSNDRFTARGRPMQRQAARASGKARRTAVLLSTAGACLFVAGMLLAEVAIAGGMSKATYLAEREKISEQFRIEKAACDPRAGNANDLCVMQAQARETNAKSDLRVAYQPSAKNRYKASDKKAQVEYAVAQVRCAQSAGKVRETCVKDAQAAEDSAKSDAKAILAKLEPGNS